MRMMSLALIFFEFPNLRFGSHLATMVGFPFLEKASLKIRLSVINDNYQTSLLFHIYANFSNYMKNVA